MTRLGNKILKMKQPIKKRVTNRNKIVKKKVATKKTKKKPLFGTSKLEEDFARDFLDKLDVKYVYQFEAKDIGRFYDFAIILNTEMTTGNILLIEIDGGYYHSDPRVVKEDKLNPMQKHNKRVDELKDKWALLHGIPLLRIWEKDIRENPKGVMKELKKRLYIEDKKVTLTEKKNKRHVNKIK
jgi:very-short-patch-repair endonuclease